MKSRDVRTRQQTKVLLSPWIAPCSRGARQDRDVQRRAGGERLGGQEGARLRALPLDARALVRVGRDPMNLLQSSKFNSNACR